MVRAAVRDKLSEREEENKNLSAELEAANKKAADIDRVSAELANLQDVLASFATRGLNGMSVTGDATEEGKCAAQLFKLVKPKGCYKD